MKKSTWIILGLVLVLGVIYVVTKPEKISVGVKHLQLPSFAQESVDRIEISGKDPGTLVKENGEWHVETGSSENVRRVKADQSAVTSMLEAAAQVSHSHYVTQLEEKLPDLGLVGEGLTTIKILSGGKPVWSLLLGKSDEEGGRYAKLPEQAQVYVVRGSFWQMIKNNLNEWRDHSIWRVPEAEITSFEIMRDGQPYLALKREEKGQEWSLDKGISKVPHSFRADQTALANLVRSGINLRASNFIDEKKDLSTPRATLSVKTKDNKEQGLQIFSTPGMSYWVKNMAGDQIFEVSKSNLDRVLKPLSELRDLSLMHFDKNEISKIVVATKKGRVVVEKSEGQWQIKEPKELPKGFEFDPSAADFVVTTIAELKAERLALAKDKATNNNWQKAPLIELSDKNNKKTSVYTSKSKTKPDEYLIQGNIDQEVYIIKGTNLKLFERELDIFKKEEFTLPPIDEHTKGFESLPVDIQRKLLDATKEKK